MRALLCLVFCCLVPVAACAPGAAQEGADSPDDMWSPGIKTVEWRVNYPFYHGLDNEETALELNRALAAPADQLRAFAGGDGLEPGAGLYMTFSVTRRTNAFVSVAYEASFMHPGAAHPVNPMFGVTADLATGRPYALLDMFTPGCDAQKLLIGEISRFAENNDAMLLAPVESLNLDLDEAWQRPGFFLTQESFVLFFQEYVFTPHVFGPLVVDIPYARLDGCLKNEFMPGRAE